MSLLANKAMMAQVRKIKIVSKRLVASHLVGNYVSAFKGVGFEFDQLREYHYGDDVRFINWNASAKNNTLMLKEFIPERDRALILAVDCSSSLSCSSQPELKRDVVLSLCAMIAFIANASADRVGLLTFADKVKTWLPPQKGRLVVTKILDDLYLDLLGGGKTNIAEPLKFLANNKLSSAIIFLVSDWIDPNGLNLRDLKLISKKHDTIAVRILDPLEKKLPPLGLLNLQDAENGVIFNINSSRLEVQKLLAGRLLQQQKMLESCGIDLLDLTVGDKLDKSLVKFFHKRAKRL